MTDTIRHEPLCQAQPGEPGPRIESFRSERTNDTGHVVARPTVTRCIECAAQTVTG
jgi:hypothetical protein